MRPRLVRPASLGSRLFHPILAGATLRARALACLGAIIGIALTGLVAALVTGHGAHLPLIVAPIGASAVLVFAVPASPLAQPWPVIGGNTLSALVGVAVARLVHDPVIASGLAVGLAIAVMSLTRSLHPPGGAAALTAVIGGSAVASAGFLFAFLPVALDSILLVALGWCFHRLLRQSYPHVPAPAPVNTHRTADPPPALRVGFREADIDGALADMGETFDIDRADLARLLRRVEEQALLRRGGPLSCADIMSRDVVTVAPNATTETARALLLDHNIRLLPVVDEDGRLVGTIGLRELAEGPGLVRDGMMPALTAAADAPALGLVQRLSDGRSHAVVIVGTNGQVEGLVTQTDLLAALARIA
ncbi:HPP family protein [Kaistia geumhonensis]|uniref:CBS domain-containing membrane protein n=1 Tax=Kaistia geumhonensis TaxID=410839 RepID=A0ABU0M125_9HYPH|nr:HPP family protein [Kaistia geumhonensis]MCX5480114.1 HPP family protein [Kaistia geumhonensis]MDQ0514657.1 CBS domain-containing membrane protein [Kaistia geumhonensis]